MSRILDALTKLDRENSFRQPGWGPIGTKILKPGPARPPKRIPRRLIYFFLTAVVIAALTYVVAVKSGVPWKSPFPASGIPPAPGPQIAQIPRDVADAPKPLPTAPAKSPALTQKLTPPPPEAASLPKSSPSKPPSYDVPARKSAPLPLVSGFPPKASSLPPVQPPAPKEEDSDGPSQPTQEGAPSNIPPELIEEGKRIRQMQQLLRQQRPAYTRDLPIERKIPAPPGTEGIGGPPIPQAPGGLPWAFPQAAMPSPNASAGALPQLKISGIIWNQDPAMRRAVVNGSFISEGSQIEGVKVVEILPTGVRFSYKNRVFEISAFD